jgi:DNA-binding transcriptional regulator YiaG
MNERVDRLMLPPLPERRRLRVDADLSVEAMAHLLGVSRPTVQKWEDGTGGPTSANRVMYAAVLQRLAHHELVAADE